MSETLEAIQKISEVVKPQTGRSAPTGLVASILRDSQLRRLDQKVLCLGSTRIRLEFGIKGLLREGVRGCDWGRNASYCAGRSVGSRPAIDVISTIAPYSLQS